MADLALGARPVVLDEPALLSRYRTAAADLRRCLMLADIAAEHGNGRRAADHLLAALVDLADDLASLRPPPTSPK